MISLTEVPAWYWAVATCLSAYYAFRGAVGNWFAHQATQSKPDAQKLPRWMIVSVFCAHDALFHFVSAIAGFVAVFVGYGLYESSVGMQTLDAGRSILLVFCVLFGLVGSTGQLPQLILQGKLPSFR